MKQDLIKQLYTKYPDMFRISKDHEGFIRPAKVVCDDGWYDIVDQLCWTISHYIDYKNNYTNEPVSPVVFSLIREKIGGLRIYWAGGDLYVRGVIDMACNISTKICEISGRPGDLYAKNGWYKSVAHDMYEELGFQKDE